VRRRLRRPGKIAWLTERMMSFGGYDVLPEVALIADGELFAGTWIIRSCCFGKATPSGYEVRFLVSDNDHFPTRRQALRGAFLRAMRTIELGEVGSMHLCPVPTSDVLPRLS